jgi:hypothetical protein
MWFTVASVLLMLLMLLLLPPLLLLLLLLLLRNARMWGMVGARALGTAVAVLVAPSSISISVAGR